MITIRIVRMPNTAIPEEFDALAAEPEVDLAFIDRPEDLGAPDMVILPGSAATIPDLAFLRESGMESAVRRAAEAGSLLFGICGGFQMMGTRIHDPERLEGGADRAEGLGLFDLETTFSRDGVDEPVAATGAGGLVGEGERVTGFELHGGRSVLRDRDAVPLFREPAKGGGSCPLGVATRDYSAIGTYLHGILADPGFRRRIVDHLRSRKAAARV